MPFELHAELGQVINLHLRGVDPGYQQEVPIRGELGAGRRTRKLQVLHQLHAPAELGILTKLPFVFLREPLRSILATSHLVHLHAVRRGDP
jgi:hypothetical protein